MKSCNSCGGRGSGGHADGCQNNNVPQPALSKLLKNLRPATPEELAAQREGWGKYTPGPRQAIPSAPIAPLLGQDEPAVELFRPTMKVYPAHGSGFFGYFDVTEMNAYLDARDRNDAQALTSLAAAQKEIEGLKSKNESLWQEMLSFQHDTATGEWVGSGWTPVQMKRVMEESAEIRKSSYAATVRAELAEAALAEAQTRISELEKELGR